MSGSSVLKISDAAALALHTAVYLAANPDRLAPAREVAAVLQVSEAHLAKVMQRLVRSGIARSVRGPKGGFALYRDASKLSMLEVFEAIEGPLHPTDCLLGPGRRCNGNGCVLGGLVSKVNSDVKNYLSSHFVADMTSVFTGEVGNEAA